MTRTEYNEIMQRGKEYHELECQQQSLTVLKRRIEQMCTDNYMIFEFTYNPINSLKYDQRIDIPNNLGTIIKIHLLTHYENLIKDITKKMEEL